MARVLIVLAKRFMAFCSCVTSKRKLSKNSAGTSRYHEWNLWKTMRTPLAEMSASPSLPTCSTRRVSNSEKESAINWYFKAALALFWAPVLITFPWAGKDTSKDFKLVATGSAVAGSAL